MGKKKADGLSKKERKALEERERILAAELAEREAAKARKKSKKGKGKKAREAIADVIDETPVEPTPKKGKSPKAKITAAAEKALATPSSPSAHEAAETALAAAEEAGPEETDEQIKARIQAKRAARAAERTPTPKTEEQRKGEKSKAHKAVDAVAGDAPLDPELAKIEERIAEAKVEVEKVRVEVTEVETEEGRVFEAGTTPDAEEAFVMPSDAPVVDFATNGLGQYLIKRPSDGKLVGYTRATTYIACLEDTTNLTKWKMRMLLEGVAVNDTAPADRGDRRDPVAATLADLIHRRDVALAKARKADRKGKLVPGQLATLVEGAWSEFKKAVNALADELLDIGGAHEKAQKGTDLHALCDLYDAQGIDAVGELLTEGKITPADLADVEAYAETMRKAGIRVIEAERVVVNDDLKVAGRLDRIVMAKLPGEQRARRRVLDIKTGRVDLGTGKIAQQIELYSGAKGYDLETHEREDLKLDRTKGLLLHLPAGTGKATLHVVDLTLGRKGNRLAGEVRAWRNEGKRAIDLKVDIAEAIATAEEA